MEDAYSGYSYKRYKRPWRIFPILVVVLVLGIGFFVANLFFGFVNFDTKKTSISLPVVTFYASQSEEFSDKTDAIALSATVKMAGGSGYLVALEQNQWTVVNEVSATEIEGGTEYTTQEKTIKICCAEHKQATSTLLGTFKTTFDTLCEYIEKYKATEMTRADISHKSRIAYNTLIDMIDEFDKIQVKHANPIYNQIIVYVTRQLLGLNLVWVDSAGADFLHVLQNAASWVIFAYFDLTNTL